MADAFEFVPSAADMRHAPRWYGPYSPARGRTCGFRVSKGEIGVEVDRGDRSERWLFEQTPGVLALANLVRRTWGGGRLLFLCGGFVVKPENDADLIGVRWLVGRFRGLPRLITPDRKAFRWASDSARVPGAGYVGPRTTGLECHIQPDASLKTAWTHPTASGSLGFDELLSGPDKRLGAGFASGRPGEVTGRVRVQLDGSVITNRNMGDGWEGRYVGLLNAERVGAQFWALHERIKKEMER